MKFYRYNIVLAIKSFKFNNLVFENKDWIGFGGSDNTKLETYLKKDLQWH